LAHFVHAGPSPSLVRALCETVCCIGAGLNPAQPFVGIAGFRLVV